MTTAPIRLISMTFDDDEPATVTASFPADTLYSIARALGALAPTYFSTEAAARFSAFYDFVAGSIANRFYDDGVQEATPRPWNPAYQLAFLDDQFTPLNASRPAAEKKLLRRHILEALASPQAADASTEGLADVIASDLEALGWRMPVYLLPRR